MAAVAARELSDGEVVFVGIGLPNLSRAGKRPAFISRAIAFDLASAERACAFGDKRNLATTRCYPLPSKRDVPHPPSPRLPPHKWGLLVIWG